MSPKPRKPPKPTRLDGGFGGLQETMNSMEQGFTMAETQVSPPPRNYFGSAGQVIPASTLQAMYPESGTPLPAPRGATSPLERYKAQLFSELGAAKGGGKVGNTGATPDKNILQITAAEMERLLAKARADALAAVNKPTTGPKPPPRPAASGAGGGAGKQGAGKQGPPQQGPPQPGPQRGKPGGGGGRGGGGGGGGAKYEKTPQQKARDQGNYDRAKDREDRRTDKSQERRDGEERAKYAGYNNAQAYEDAQARDKFFDDAREKRDAEREKPPVANNGNGGATVDGFAGGGDGSVTMGEDGGYYDAAGKKMVHKYGNVNAGLTRARGDLG